MISPVEQVRKVKNREVKVAQLTVLTSGQEERQLRHLDLQFTVLSGNAAVLLALDIEYTY